MGTKKSAERADRETPIAPDPEIARVADALALPDAGEDDRLDNLEPEEPKPLPARKKKRPSDHTHVVTDWCGCLVHNGKRYEAGESLALTDAEARSIGEKNVEPL